ncbi:ATP-binding protein [uncultured Aquimarina sp.]|uniref:tetratricopeptide repeat-containing sensor histidine kinase n=1 Tax=uncultured Aquimarina sp. TaxID=575652 RepID=UPI002614460F|nr:ATP-binding protein [uncultured Aquimarina sp.]
MTTQKLLYSFLLLIGITTQAQTENDYCELWRKQMDTISSSEALFRLSNQTISKVDDECKIEIYLALTHTYKYIEKFDEALSNCNQAIILGESLKKETSLSSLYVEKANILLSQNHKDKEAYVWLDKAKKILDKDFKNEAWVLYYNTKELVARKSNEYNKAIIYADSVIGFLNRTNNEIGIPTRYQNIGLYHFNLSNYEESAKNLLKAIQLKEGQNNILDLEDIYYFLGRTYLRWGHYDTAIKYINKSIPIAKKRRDNYVLLLCYAELVKCNQKLNKNDDAIKVADYALKLARDQKDYVQIAELLKEKGWIYFENLKQNDKAEVYFKEAYQIAKKSKDDSTLYASIRGLIEIYLHEKKYKKVKSYLKSFENITNKINSIHFKQKFYQVSSRYYEKTGQSFLALNQLKKYYSIKDSISSEQVMIKVADLEKQYDTKKKELAIVSLNQEKEEQEQIAKQAKAQQNLYLLAAGFLLFLLIAGAWAFRKLRKQQKALTSTNQVKNRLFSIIAHDLRGMILPFQRSGKILKYHIDKGNHEKTIELSQALEKNSENLSNMLDNLLNWSLEQMNGYKMNPETISIGGQLNEIISGYEQQASYKKTKIDLKFEEDLKIIFDKGAFHVIFRNLIGNALKYTEEGNIRIECTSNDDMFLCSITDTGVGMSQDQIENLFTLEEKKSTIGTQGEKGTGLGLNLVYRFVKMHKGTITVSSEKRIGTQFELNFPVSISLQSMKVNNPKQLSA